MQTKLRQLFDNQQSTAIAAMLLALLAVVSDVIGMPFLLSISAMLSAVVVGVITLQRGAKAGFMVLLWALLPALSTLVVRYYSLADSVLLLAVMAWLMALPMRRGVSWFANLAALCGVLLVLMAAVRLLVPNVTNMLEQLFAVKSAILAAPDAYASLGIHLAQPTPDDIAMMMTLASKFMLSFVASMALMQVIFVMMIMQSVHTFVFRQLPAKGASFSQLRVPMIATLVWMLCLVVSFNSSIALFADIVPIGGVVLLFAGFCVFDDYFREYSRKQPNKQWVVVAFYLFIVFVPFALFILFAAGLIDSFVNFRRVRQRRQTYSMQ